MKNRETSVSLLKWIRHSYLKTALVPLVLVELVFIGIYFVTSNWSQYEMTHLLKSEVNEELSQIVELEVSSIQQQLSGITYTTQMYANQTADALQTPQTLLPEDAARLSYSEDGVYHTIADNPHGGAAIFYSGIVPIASAEREKAARALQTQGLMKSIQQSNPLIASIYLNTYDSLNIIYPYFDVISQYAAHMDIPSYNFYYEADAAHNPTRSVQWTDVYLDPAGHGWMASCIAPVYTDDFLEGVVGIDITVSTITEQVLNLDIPWDGYGILVGQDGTILALPRKGEADWGLTELTNHSYNEAILEDTFKPEQFNLFHSTELSAFSENLSEHASGFSTLMLKNSAKVVSWSTISETGWKLILIAPENNIYAKVNQMKHHLLLIGSLMIAGLILFYSVFFLFLYRRSRKMSLDISQPLLTINEMVRSIGNGNYYQISPPFTVQELDETTHHLVEMGRQLGDANQLLLNTQMALQENEAYQQVLIRSLDDVIFEVDENGVFSNIRTSDAGNLSVHYLSDGPNSIDTVFQKTTADHYLATIQTVLETGKTAMLEYQLDTPKGLQWFQARISLIQNGVKKAVVSARNITDRKLMEQSILSAKEEAEKASHAKSQFLSNMSHELRTPLNAVLGFAQLLNMDPSDPLSESQAQSVKEIEKAGKHLLDLINEVLDLEKVEAGKASISIEPVRVCDIMEETLSLMKPIAEQHSISIQHPTCEDHELLYIKADFIRIKQVLINLLSNAIKYNKPNGTIHFFFEQVNDRLRFHVVDTGIGIPSSELGKIFDPFYRFNDAKNTIEGTGIGLATVKQLTEMMGGTVFVESELDKGSHFYVDYPLSISTQNEVSSTMFHTTSHTDAATEAKDSYTVLYVEDNPANLTLVQQIFHALPYVQLLTATTAEMGLQLAKETSLDLILLDINLPHMDGYALVTALRQLPALSNIIIIAISANAMDGDIQKALSLGFDDYITKPIDIANFIKKIKKALLGNI